MDKARDLNQNWRLYRGPCDSSRGSQGPCRNPNAQIQEVILEEPLNAEINATQSKGRFQK
jgi:hypothetical protein